MSTTVNILVTYTNSFATSPNRKFYELSYTLADPGLRSLITPKIHSEKQIGEPDEENGVFATLGTMLDYYFVDAAEELMTELNGAQDYEPFTYGILVTVDQNIQDVVGSKQTSTDGLNQLAEFTSFSTDVISLLHSTDMATFIEKLSPVISSISGLQLALDNKQPVIEPQEHIAHDSEDENLNTLLGSLETVGILAQS